MGTYTTYQLKTTDLEIYRDLMQLFSAVFEDPSSYQSKLPSDQYVTDFLSNPSHIVLVNIDANNQVIGGLVAYELKKFEQERSEIYIYDLAVLSSHHRQGIGTQLIEKLKEISKQMNAYVIFVQADEGDDPALSFYRSLSTEEIIAHHFDISVIQPDIDTDNQ